MRTIIQVFRATPSIASHYAHLFAHLDSLPDHVFAVPRGGFCNKVVKMKNFANSENKFGYVYVLTSTGMAEKAAITHHFLRRKMDKYEALKAEIETLKIKRDAR